MPKLDAIIHVHANIFQVLHVLNMQIHLYTLICVTLNVLSVKLNIILITIIIHIAENTREVYTPSCQIELSLTITFASVLSMYGNLLSVIAKY